MAIIPTVKGMTNMNYSKQTHMFATQLVSHYAKWDKLANCYTLNLSNIPNFDIYEFSTFLMNDDCTWAAEATGPDNPAYEDRMLPALIRYMRNTTNKDNEIEFNRIWRDGIASYFANAMQQLLDEKCEGYIHSEYVSSNLYNSKQTTQGVRRWF